MLKRKFIGFIITSILSTLFLILWFSEGEIPKEIFSMVGALSLFVFPVVLFYGLPSSILSEKLTNSFTGYKRILLSLLVHLLFGIAFVFLIGLIISPVELFTNFMQYWRGAELFFIAATVTSIIFWMVDEVLRLILDKKLKGF